MNTGIMIHSKRPDIQIEFVHFDNFVSTKISVTDPDGSDSHFDILSPREPAINLLPTRNISK